MQRAMPESPLEALKVKPAKRGGGKARTVKRRSVPRLIYLPPDVDERLRQRAFETRTPMSRIVAEAVELHLGKKPARRR